MTADPNDQANHNNPGPYHHPYPPAPQPAKPKRHPFRTFLSIVGGVVVSIMIMAVIASLNTGGGSPDPVIASPADVPAKADPAPADKEPYTLKVTGCERDDNPYLEQVKIDVRITNNSDRKGTYLFDISVEDSDGNVVGTGFGSVDNVRPGKSGKAAAFASMTDKDYDGDITCLVEVSSW